MAVELAKSGMRPTVSLFGSLSTNFSSIAKDFSNPTGEPVIVQGPDIPVIINGQQTIENDQQTNVYSGRLLRHGKG